MGSVRFDGVLFVAYSNDHPPPHIHAFISETEVIIDLRRNGAIALAKRKDAVQPANTKRSDVKEILNTAARHFEELAACGRKYMARYKMARHRIVTTDDEIDQAIERAKAIRRGPLVTEVEYRPGPGLDLLILKLSDGSRRVIPREDLQGLQSATKDQVARVEILGGGTGLHWPDLDADFCLPGLLRGVFGNEKWMAEIGSRGGAVRSAAKKRAARANGLKGGRPRRNEVAAGD